MAQHPQESADGDWREVAQRIHAQVAAALGREPPLGIEELTSYLQRHFHKDQTREAFEQMTDGERDDWLRGVAEGIIVGLRRGAEPF